MHIAGARNNPLPPCGRPWPLRPLWCMCPMESWAEMLALKIDGCVGGINPKPYLGDHQQHWYQCWGNIIYHWILNKMGLQIEPFKCGQLGHCGDHHQQPPETWCFEHLKLVFFTCQNGDLAINLNEWWTRFVSPKIGDSYSIYGNLHEKQSSWLCCHSRLEWNWICPKLEDWNIHKNRLPEMGKGRKFDPNIFTRKRLSEFILKPKPCAFRGAKFSGFT